jgi:hypothetical protein
MPHEYAMDQCPACGAKHYYTAVMGVPYWEKEKGVRFTVVCPNSQKKIEVDIPPDSPSPQRAVTDVLCTTCGKAYMGVVSEKPRGTAVQQVLECSNPGCGCTLQRVVNPATGKSLT